MNTKINILKEYRRERRRILATINRYKKLGLDVNLVVPNIPKNVTSGSIRRLKKISLKKIQESSYGPSYETGERIDFGKFTRQRRRLLKQERLDKQKAKEIGGYYDWQAALDTYHSTIEQYPDRAENLVIERERVYINQHGERAYGYAVKKLIESGKLISPKEGYIIPLVLDMLNNLGALLNLSPDDYKLLVDDIDQMNANEEYNGEWFDWY